MTQRSYRFFVQPTRDLTNEAFAEVLARHGISPQESEHAFIEVQGKKVLGVYEVPHTFVTMLKRSYEHRYHVRVFVQEGEGAIRPYALYSIRGNRIHRAKSVRDAKEKLRDLTGNTST
jgi:hypothetical protein